MILCIIWVHILFICLVWLVNSLLKAIHPKFRFCQHVDYQEPASHHKSWDKAFHQGISKIVVPVYRLVDSSFSNHAVSYLKNGITKLDHQTYEEMGPAENYVINAKFYEQKDHRKCMLIVTNIDENIINNFFNDLIMSHYRSVCCHRP